MNLLSPLKCLGFSLILLFFTACEFSGSSETGPYPKYAEFLNAFENDSAYFVDQGKLFQPLSPEQTGIDFQNPFKETFEINVWRFLYNMAGGATIADFNNDNLPDICLTGNMNGERLYINKGGLKFEDITTNAGFGEPEGFHAAASVVDINQDGFKDLYICRAGPTSGEKRKNLLFINNGDLTFTEKAEEYGLADTSYSLHANFFDFDKDGDLDMYLLNHPVDFLDKSKFKAYDIVEKGANSSDHFYINNGDNTFTEASKKLGINNHGYGLSVSVADINEDGYLDVYVTNDFSMPDLLYINQNGKGFSEQMRERFKKNSLFAMGSDIEDFNDDGHLDLAVADIYSPDNYTRKTIRVNTRYRRFKTMVKSGYFYQYPRNSFQLNNGDGTFSDVGEIAGTSDTDWSWSPLFVDFDNDGDKDFFISNGYYYVSHSDNREPFKGIHDAIRRDDTAGYFKYRNMTAREHWKSPNRIFRNDGDLNFVNQTTDWGFDIPTFTFGAAYADFDQDGDIDILVNNINQNAFIYENRANTMRADHHFLKVKLATAPEEPAPIGAEVFLLDENDNIQQMRHYSPVKGFMSYSGEELHFGLGETTSVKQLLVKWPDGKTQRISNINADQTLWVHYKDAEDIAFIRQKDTTVFNKIPNRLGIAYQHEENDYNDMDHEFLLHHKMSENGPGVAVGDVNRDGLDDIFLGGSKGSIGKLYLQQSAGKFKEAQHQPCSADKECEDLGVLFFDADGDNDQDLYVVSGGNESRPDDPALQDRLYINDGQGNFTQDKNALPLMHTSGSTVNAADYDRDGDLDLFIGGRVIPGQYPMAPRSYLLENNNGRFSDVTAAKAPDLMNPGLITSALWTDYNMDGWSDLIIVGEWMPITVFANEKGTLKNTTSSTGISEYTGWWQGITGGDFDNDGDIDYIIGNIGNNVTNQTSLEEPVELFYHDFNDDNNKDMVISYYNFGKRYPAQSFERLGEQMPELRKEYKNYHEFGVSTLEDMFGAKGLDKAWKVNATTFDHVYINNNGDGTFTINSLPKMAQLSPLLGMETGDFNGDGFLDLVAHGNIHGTDPMTFRYDAGDGIFLVGKGDGSFEVKRGHQSGFKSDGNARGLARLFSGSQEVLVAAACNSSVEVFAPKGQGYILELNSGDVRVVAKLKHGKSRTYEPYYGSGYLSSGSRKIMLPYSCVSATITNSKGEERTVEFPLELSKK